MLASLVFSPACFAQNADFIAASAAKSLRSAPYKNVRITICGNSVTLTGSVVLYSMREDAEYRVRHIRGIRTVRNEIQVDTPAISDRRLQSNVGIAISASIHRRLGSVPNLSDLLSVRVDDGVVTLEGRLPDIQLERNVFNAVAQTKGVREVIDRIQSGFNPELISVWPPNYGTGEARSAF